MCNRNIRAFLKACSTIFKLDEKKLFKAKDLYEATNFEAVSFPSYVLQYQLMLRMQKALFLFSLVSL